MYTAQHLPRPPDLVSRVSIGQSRPRWPRPGRRRGGAGISDTAAPGPSALRPAAPRPARRLPPPGILPGTPGVCLRGPAGAAPGSRPSVLTPRADVSPPTADVSPPTADVSPPTADVSPPTADVSPPTADVSPPTADVSPRWNSHAARFRPPGPPRGVLAGPPGLPRAVALPAGDAGVPRWAAGLLPAHPRLPPGHAGVHAAGGARAELPAGAERSSLPAEHLRVTPVCDTCV
eukprot:1179349-Prorocentrum_minimum.AAC.2